MIEITTARADWTGWKTTKFDNVYAAERFLRKMKKDGYRIVSVACDNPEDGEYLGGKGLC